MYSKDLEQLIDAALADGIITDKERAVIKKRAEKEGIDLDEIDVYLDGRLAKLQSEKSHIVNEAPKIQQAVEIPQKTSQASYTKYWIIIALCVFAIIVSHFLIEEKPLAKQIAERNINNKDLLGMLQETAKIASTKINIRRMGVYDSDLGESDITRPGFWKIGDRGCVIPVDITIEFGIDLNKMDKNSIIVGSGDSVIIKLPSPEIIGSEFNEAYDENDVVAYNRGLRDIIDETEIQKIVEKTYSKTVNDTAFIKCLNNEINENTKIIFGAMIRKLGLEPVFVN